MVGVSWSLHRLPRAVPQPNPDPSPSRRASTITPPSPSPSPSKPARPAKQRSAAGHLSLPLLPSALSLHVSQLPSQPRQVNPHAASRVSPPAGSSGATPRYAAGPFCETRAIGAASCLVCVRSLGHGAGQAGDASCPFGLARCAPCPALMSGRARVVGWLV